jgi:hypothetical protein
VTTFLELARQLVHKRGISIVPVVPGEKSPGWYDGNRWHDTFAWGQFRERLPTEDEIAKWASWPDVGIAGILCPFTRLVAVDFDYHPELHATIASLLPETPVKKRGVKGLTWFYRHSGEKNQGWEVNGKKVVEILANHLCTLPPSVHPDAVIYEWVGPGLDEIDAENLPTLPVELPEQLNALFAVLDPKKRNRPATPSPSPVYSRPAFERTDDFERMEEALTYISSDDYETWVEVGMAINAGFPAGDGFAAWDRWSQRSPKYAKNRPGTMNQKWKSFGAEKGRTLGTVFHLAKEGGYISSLPKMAVPPPVTIEAGGNLKPTTLSPIAARQSPTFALPEDLLRSAPGLVGDVAAWLTINNFYHQFAYSLAAALSFVGMLKAHQVATEEDARTNLLTIAVGPSGSGKSDPIKGLVELAREVGVSEQMLGEPASEQGLLKGLFDAKNKGLLPWDEIGLSFKGMFAPNAPAYKSGVIRVMMKLYTYADTVFYGSQYANHDGKIPRLDLVQPCLCLYGTTTADGIYGAFSSQEAINGFAARLLIFETHDYVSERHDRRKVAVPPELIEGLKAVGGIMDPSEGNLADVSILRTVPYSADARRLVKEASLKFEKLKNEAILEKREGEAAIWARAYEHSIKVALTVEDSQEITAKSVKWAIELIEHLSRNMIVAAGERMADNQTHAELNIVLRIIREARGEWVSTKDLYTRTRSLPRFKRQEHLNQLIEEGTVEWREEETSGRKRKLYRYVGTP